MALHLNSEAIFSIILTFKVALICILLFLSIGSLLIFFLYVKKNGLLKKIVNFLIEIPLSFPPIVIGFILLWLLSNDNWFGEILNKMHIHLVFNIYSLIIAGFIAGLPLYVKPIVSAIENFPKNIIEASLISGKSQMSTFFRVILPSIKKIILSSLLLSISRVLGEVGISLMLGGNIPFRTNTISLEIFTSVFNSDLHTAMILSLILFILSFVIFTLSKFIMNFKGKQ